MRNVIIFIFCVLLILLDQRSEAWFGHYNPQERLEYANDLIFEFGRPLAADPLINEVIKFCTKENDESCLANAYLMYGKLVASYPDDTPCKWYKTFGFRDRTITCENRHKKILDYYEKALLLAQKNKLYDTISQIYLNMGEIYFLDLEEQKSACYNYDQSLQYHRLFMKNNPEIEVTGDIKFEEIIAKGKKVMDCP